MSFISPRWRKISAAVALAACALIIMLRCFVPASASEEYLYTTEWFVRFLLPPFAAYLLILLLTSDFLRRLKKGRLAGCLAALGLVLLFVPFLAPKMEAEAWRMDMALSLCWAASFICLGLGFFLLGASGSALRSGIFCLLGSLFLALGLGEACLLATPQQWDGLYYANSLSSYVKAGEAMAGDSNYEIGKCGFAARHSEKPESVALRYMRYDEQLYDAKYDYDTRGRRALPKSGENPEYDLLLFGCSFTFGAGLNNEQTWAWRLAKDLGPAWKVENYSQNGYSANQMLCLLEHDLVEAPAAPRRYALFLGINDHMRRNEFFEFYPHYQLDASGLPVQQGESRHTWINNLPKIFRGSQLAMLFSRIGTGAIVNLRKNEYESLYLAMILRSSQILREKYGTRLIVMLWPCLEFMAPEFEQRGIPVIFAKTMLPSWEPDGHPYQIKPRYEGHPNAMAARDLANGLSAYFRKLAKQN